MIRKFLLAVMLAAGASSCAFAQTSFTAKDASGTTQTFKSFNCNTSNICSLSVPADTTGAAFGVTGNPFFVSPATGATFPVNNAGTFAVQNNAATPAGTNIIGKVGIDQTTPGTTNLVSAGQNGAWSVTANAGTNLNTSALATSANQTNKTQFTQLTDGTNAAATYTAYGTAPTGNVPGFNAFVTNSNANGAAASTSSSPTVLPILNHASTTALGTSLVAKASAGNLNSFNCTAITGGAAGFCIAYNGTTAPATGALTGANVLDFCYFDTTARGCSLSHLNGSIAFSTGIVILATSAASPYTYTTGTDTAAIEADIN